MLHQSQRTHERLNNLQLGSHERKGKAIDSILHKRLVILSTRIVSPSKCTASIDHPTSLLWEIAMNKKARMGKYRKRYVPPVVAYLKKLQTETESSSSATAVMLNDCGETCRYGARNKGDAFTCVAKDKHKITISTSSYKLRNRSTKQSWTINSDLHPFLLLEQSLHFQMQSE